MVPVSSSLKKKKKIPVRSRFLMIPNPPTLLILHLGERDKVNREHIQLETFSIHFIPAIHLPFGMDLSYFFIFLLFGVLIIS